MNNRSAKRIREAFSCIVVYALIGTCAVCMFKGIRDDGIKALEKEKKQQATTVTPKAPEAKPEKRKDTFSDKYLREKAFKLLGTEDPTLKYDPVYQFQKKTLKDFGIK